MKMISFWTGGGGLFSGTVSLLDVFSIANLCHRNRSGKNTSPIFETEILTTDGGPVEAHGGIHVQPDRAIHDVKQTDCIVISPYLLDLYPILIPSIPWRWRWASVQGILKEGLKKQPATCQ